MTVVIFIVIVIIALTSLIPTGVADVCGAYGSLLFVCIWAFYSFLFIRQEQELHFHYYYIRGTFTVSGCNHSGNTCLKSSFTSGQDGGIGRHGSSPCPTTSTLQLKQRTDIIQNCQKLSWMEIWPLQIKETRWIGGVQMLNGVVSHLPVVDKNLGGISWEWGLPALY